MSHSHTHGPGETHSHSHSPASPQTAVLPTPDSKLVQAMIEEDFLQVPLALSADRNTVVCAKHSLEKCRLCDLDFVSLNRLSTALLQHPTLLCPPPGNVITPKITQLVTSTKEEGNVCFCFVFYLCIYLTYRFSMVEPVQSSKLSCCHHTVHRSRGRSYLPTALGVKSTNVRRTFYCHLQPLCRVFRVARLYLCVSRRGNGH